MAINIQGNVGGNLGARQVFGASIGGNIEPRNAQKIVDNWNRFKSWVFATAPRATRNALIPTFEKSQIYCPKETGKLVDSGYLELTGRYPREAGQTPLVEIGYGRNGNPPYALVVHEMVQYRHKSPTRAKYLESALNEDRSKILPRIQGQLRV